MKTDGFIVKDVAEHLYYNSVAPHWVEVVTDATYYRTFEGASEVLKDIALSGEFEYPEDLIVREMVTVTAPNKKWWEKLMTIGG